MIMLACLGHLCYVGCDWSLCHVGCYRSHTRDDLRAYFILLLVRNHLFDVINHAMFTFASVN